MKIGFVGLGNVGGKLAGSLLRNKFNLTVIDLNNNFPRLNKQSKYWFTSSLFLNKSLSNKKYKAKGE